MPRFTTFGEGGEVDGFVEVDLPTPPAAGGTPQLLYHPRYPVEQVGGFLLPANIQAATFVGFAERDYVAGEVFEHRWALEDLGAAVDVVFAQVGLCKQATPLSFDPADPVFLNVVAARDVSAQIVVAGAYTAVLEVSPIPDPQTIARGDPLWIVWAVTCSTTQPTFRANVFDRLTPLYAQGTAVAWQPELELGAPASTFTPSIADAPIAGLTKAPFP